MSARRLLAPLAVALGTAFASSAHAAIHVYHCILDPRQETSAVASTAQGSGRFVIDTDANTVSYRIVYAGLVGTETAAHIHGSATGAPGANSGVLTALPAGSPKVGVWSYTEAQEPMILQGRCYANIHTSSFGGGEIRGQIVPFNALLDGGQEVPANAATGSGWATATVDTAANTISYYISYSGLTGAPTAAHFHGNRLHGASGGVKVGLTAGPSPMTGTVSYLQADEGQLLSGMFYINLHTAAFGGGEIRGQLVPTVIPMDALQEVPAGPATGSSGFALVAVDTAANALSYDVRLQSLSSAETAAHIHGFAGSASTAGVQAGLTAGARKLGTWTYGAANEVSVMSGLAYFNIHTSANGGGEIRGQIERLPGAAAILDVVSGPRSFAGLTAAPNPFGRRTSVSFALTRTGSVERTVVGVDGRVVRSFPSATFAPGTHSFDWDGLDDAGRDATPGVYFAVVRTAEGVRTTRLARIR